MYITFLPARRGIKALEADGRTRTDRAREMGQRGCLFPFFFIVVFLTSSTARAPVMLGEVPVSVRSGGGEEEEGEVQIATRVRKRSRREQPAVD